MLLAQNATDYAILISAGEASDDDQPGDSEYWYDLYLAYEDLILFNGYSPENVYVFYGDGNDFVSDYPRYNNLTSIVDFNNAYSTIESQIQNNIGPTISNDDNVLIWWVVGHGCGSSAQGTTTSEEQTTYFPPYPDADDYWVRIEHSGNLWVRESAIITLIDTYIPDYKRRKILWMTCGSGCITQGSNHLINERTVIITSSDWNEPSFSDHEEYEDNYHAQFNYVITSTLSQYTPSHNGYPYGDENGDNVINMWELYNHASESPIMDSEPQLGYSVVNDLSDKIYIDEHPVINATEISESAEYIVNDFEFLNSSVGEELDVEIEFDTGFKINGSFSIPIGSTLYAHPEDN